MPFFCRMRLATELFRWGVLRVWSLRRLGHHGFFGQHLRGGFGHVSRPLALFGPQFRDALPQCAMRVRYRVIFISYARFLS